MDWFVLGIEPTKDKKAITAAYRQKLRQTNPEDKPEEFKALRAAYEEALALADRNDMDAVRDESPVGIWMEAVSSLYRNYSARIDPEQWKELLQDQVCIALDTRPTAEEALLKFLMQNFYLPRSVWIVLDEAFHFSERVEELYESYPREFVDRVIINGLRFDTILAFDLFIPGLNGADCDAYRRLYYQANHTPVAQLAPILEQMDALSERHPYGEALRCRFWLGTGRTAEGKEGFRKLAEDYPNDDSLTLAWAASCLEDGQAEEAESIARRVLDRMPDHVSAKNILVQCLTKKERYHEAKELTYELMRTCAGNPVMMAQYTEQLKGWNQKLIPEREARWNACPDDTENAIELAWCYVQCDCMDDAMELAQRIDSEKAEPYEYHNLMGKLYHNHREPSEALEHLRIVEQLVRALEPDGTRKTQKRRNRLPELLQIQGNCLMQLEETEAAREKFEEALKIAPEDPEVLTLMGKILFASGEYAHAVEILERLVHVSPGSYYGESLLALSLYRLHRDKDAFDAVNRALAIQGNDLSLYIFKMQILIRNRVWDQVHGILDFLEKSGAPKDISTDYVKAQLTELELKDTNQAFVQYQAIARRVEGGETLICASELYYRMALLMGDRMDMSNEEDRDILIAQLDKALAHDKQDMDCLAYKAWILKQSRKTQEAIDIYRDLEAKNPNSMTVQRDLAQLYYENLNGYAQEALDYYERLLKTQQTSRLYFYAANSKRHLGDLEGARAYYLRELEMAPDDIDGFRGLAYVCDAQGKYAESLDMLNQAIAIMEGTQNEYMWLLEHKVRVLCRMGQYDQALAFVDDIMARYQYDAGYQRKFDICCQFGLWDRAKQVLDAWKKARENDPDLLAATGTLYLLTGKMLMAVTAMGTAKHKLSAEQAQDFRLQLADLECNYKRQIEIWEHRTKQNRLDDRAVINLAQALWHGGRRTDAQRAAQKALTMLDLILTRTRTDEALFRSRRCLALALLGRVGEARAELEKTRKLPLCHHCKYGSCKDADIYEAAIEEILGNREKALQLYRAGRANWPDELDFAAGEARLKRKGRK